MGINRVNEFPLGDAPRGVRIFGRTEEEGCFLSGCHNHNQWSFGNQIVGGRIGDAMDAKQTQ